MLKQEGRKSAGDFLAHYGADLGIKSSAELVQFAIKKRIVSL